MEITFDQSFASVASSGGGNTFDGEGTPSSRFKTALLDNVPIPVTVNALLDAPFNLDDPTPVYTIAGFNFKTIKVIGSVASKQVTQSEAIYELIDTTATDRMRAKKFICVRYVHGNPPSTKKFEPEVGDVVMVVGKLRVFNNRIAATLLGMRDIDDEKVVKLHIMECKVAQIFYKKLLLKEPSQMDEYEGTAFSPYPPPPRNVKGNVPFRQTPNTTHHP